MLARLRQTSIRTKLTVLVFGVTVLSVGGGLTLLATQRAAELEAELVSTAETLARTVAEYTESSLAFADEVDAAGALAKLASFPTVEVATLYDERGEQFATYRRPGAHVDPAAQLRPQQYSVIVRGHVIVQVPAIHDDHLYGAVVLQASAETLDEKRSEFFVTLLAFFGLFVFMAGAVSFSVHRMVGRPLAAVAEVASRVAAGGDPPRNLAVRGTGEIAVLADALGEMFRELDRRAAAEAALAEKDRQLQHAQKQEVVGRLAAGVAHDFNNLLTIIMSCSSMIESSAADQEVRELALDAMMAADRGAALTKRLTALSAPGSSLVTVFDVVEAVHDFEKILRALLVETVAFTLTLPGAPVLVRADRGQLEQVLLNLVINAQHAMPQGGTLELAVRSRDQRVEVVCVDDGEGMDEVTLARIFEPFFTTKARGTGLGLATSRQMLRGFGGDLTARSERGVGTTMTVTLQAADRLEDSAEVTAAEAPRAKQLTVLLVEDEAPVRSSVRRLLERAGHRVLECPGPDDALALARDGAVRIDLLLSDVVMPGMSGPELAEELLRLRPGLPVLLMSGHVGDVLATHGLDGETANVLQKPFTPATLASRIDALFERIGKERLAG